METKGNAISNLLESSKTIHNTTNITRDIHKVQLNAVEDPLKVDFTFSNDSSCSGTTIKFISIVPGSGYTYKWNFGDNSTSTQNNPSHVYNSTGCGNKSYTVSLTVSNDSTSGTTSKIVTVKQKPEISLVDVDNPFDPFSNCSNASILNPQYTITVDKGSASNCVSSYSLDWGDGSALVSNPSFPLTHTYGKPGVFDMIITAYGNNGCINSVKYVVKNQTNPSGGLISPGTTTNLCAPTDELKFEIANWGANSPGTRYFVDFGDGSPIVELTQEQLVGSQHYKADDPSSSENYPIPHRYTQSNCPASEFIATLTVVNACDDTKFTADNITILTKPDPDFEVPPICLNFPVTFKNKTDPGGGRDCSTLVKYTWNFGDGSPVVIQTQSNPQNVVHTYTSPGNYNVTLSVENYCGVETITKPVTVGPLPTATISGGGNFCQGDNSPSIVFTGANGSPPYTFTYKINNGAVQTISTGATSSSVSVTVPTNASGSFIYTLVSVKEGSASSCSQPQPGEVKVEIISAISALISGTDTVCINSSSPRITFTGYYGVRPYTFSYNINGGPGKTITTSNGDTISIAVPTDVGGVFSYNLTDVKDNKVNDSACKPVLNGTAIITVNNQPPEPLILDNYEFCNGEVTPPVNFTNSVPGTVYTWTNSDISIGLPDRGSGNIESFVAKNSTANSVISLITVTPYSYGCTGSSGSFSITVHPATSVEFSQQDQSICSGENTTEVLLSSETAGAVISWTLDQPTGITESLQLSGANSIPSQTLTNSTNNQIDLIYKAKATISGATTCAGMENQYTIKVFPTPLVRQNFIDTICSGYSFNIIPVHSANNIVPAGTKFIWNEPVVNPVGAITGVSAQQTPVSSIGQTLQNTTSSLASVTYRVTPLVDNCEGQSFEVTVSVIPNTTLVPVSDIYLCNGDQQNEIVFSDNTAGKIYRWSSNNSNIGIAASGSDKISSFKAYNTGTSPEKATITVESNSEIGSSSCDVSQIQFSITVNPSAQVNNPGEQFICSDNDVLIPFTTLNTGGTTTYAWKNSNPGIGLASSGSGDISFRANNNTDSIVTALILVTPTYTNNGLSCQGQSEQFLVKINPPFFANKPSDQKICSGNNIPEIIFSGSNSGIVYNWKINNSIGLPESGTGNIPEFTAFNDEADSIVAVISVTPGYNGCEGIPIQFTITVHPSSVILKQPSSSLICLGEKPTVLSVIHTSGVSAPGYQWYSNTSNSFIGALIIPGEKNSVYIPPSSDTGTRYYFCEITFSGYGGCNFLTSDIARVKISPNPVVILNDEQISPGEELKICPGETINIRAKGAESYLWNAGWSGDSILVKTIGDYRAIGISNNGCKDTVSFKVSYYQTFNYTIQTDKTVLTDDENQVNLWTESTENSFYTWNFGDGTTGFGYDVTHLYDITSDGYFDVQLEVINPFGCIEEASVKIFTDLELTSIPNTFTPNADGINDIFLDGWYKKIYNRNGILLYEGKLGWDGYYKGNPVDNDTYFVVIYDSSELGAEYKRTYVTVIR